MLPAWFTRRLRAKDAAGSIPYCVQCVCGTSLNGQRASKAQKIVCPKCRLPTLIFPFSSLMRLGDSDQKDASSAAPTEAPTKVPPAIWKRPLLAGGIALIIVIVLFSVLLADLFQSAPTVTSHAEQIRAEIAAGQQALAESAPAQAAEHFHRARQSGRGELPEPQLRWLEQMEKEARLMADLSSESLSEMLQLMKGSNDKAWRGRYENKAIIFDTLVQSVGGGVHRLDYRAFADGSPVLIEVHDSPLLRFLQIERPTRLILGVRLAAVRRDTRGNWLVLANSESLVLFTEPAVFLGGSLAMDADLEAALRKQAALLDIVSP